MFVWVGLFVCIIIMVTLTTSMAQSMLLCLSPSVHLAQHLAFLQYIVSKLFSDYFGVY